MFVPASNFEIVHANLAPRLRRYRLELDVGSDRTLTTIASHEQVADIEGLGFGAGLEGSTTLELALALEAALRDCCGSARGTLLPLPGAVDADSSEYADLKAVIAKMSGDVVLIESGVGSHGRDAVNRAEMKPVQLGPWAEGPIVELRAQTERSLLAEMGVPAELLGVTNSALSGDRRELSRQLQAQVVNPIARLLEHELRRVLDEPALTLTFPRSRTAADYVSLARSVKSLTDSGLGLAAALQAVSFETGEVRR